MKRLVLVLVATGLGGCQPKGEDGWFVLLHGLITDEAGAALPDATLTFFSGDGSGVGSSTTDEAGEWRLPVFGTELVGNRLTASIEAEGMADAWATWPANLRAPVTSTLEAGPWETWQITDRQLATVRVAAESATGSVTGTVVDASTGLPVEGVALEIRQGWNAPEDTFVAAEGTTDATGAFEFTLYPAGPYTITALPIAGELVPGRFPVFLGATPTRAVGMVSPAVDPTLLRASIVWGEGAADLDLHLSAPRSDGSAGSDGNGQYHVWSGRPAHPENDPDGIGPDAALELSDSDGGGPETIAVYRPPGQGVHVLSVFDNDHADDSSSTALANTGVVMQVWYGQDEPTFYEIGPGVAATLWNPVEIETQTSVQYAVELYRSGYAADDAEAFYRP